MIFKRKKNQIISYELFNSAFREEYELETFNNYYLLQPSALHKNLNHSFTSEISQLIYNLIYKYQVSICIKYFKNTSTKTTDKINFYVKSLCKKDFIVLTNADYTEIRCEFSLLTCNKIASLYKCIVDLDEDIYITFYGYDMIDINNYKMELSIDYSHPVLNILCVDDKNKEVVNICINWIAHNH